MTHKVVLWTGCHREVAYDDSKTQSTKSLFSTRLSHVCGKWQPWSEPRPLNTQSRPPSPTHFCSLHGGKM